MGREGRGEEREEGVLLTSGGGHGMGVDKTPVPPDVQKGDTRARAKVTGVVGKGAEAGDFPVSPSTALSLITEIRKRLENE